VQRLVHARERGIPGDTDDGAEADDPLIGASVEPGRWTPTPLTPEEVDAIRTAYASGVSTVELARQYGVYRTTVWRKVMDATGATGVLGRAVRMTDPQGTAKTVSQSRTIATASCDAALPRLPQGVGDGVERPPPGTAFGAPLLVHAQARHWRWTTPAGSGSWIRLERMVTSSRALMTAAARSLFMLHLSLSCAATSRPDACSAIA
jgi:hypothetical protein